jgi:hypothetical protein
MTRWILLTVCLTACNGSAGGPAPAPADAAPAGGGLDGGTRDGSSVADEAGAPDGGGGADAGGGTRVTLTNTSAAAGSGLAWVAFQDGDGLWQTVDGVGGIYSFAVASGRYGVAFVCDLGDLVPAELVQATVAELPALTTSCNPAGQQHQQRLSGTFRGVDPGGGVTIAVGGGREDISPATRPNPPPITYDLMLPAGVYDVVGAATKGGVESAVIAREVTVKGDTQLDLDFTGAVSLIQQPFTVMGASGKVSVIARLTTGHGTIIDWPSSATSYAGLPESGLGPDDIQEVTVSAIEAAGGMLSERGVVLGVRAPAPVNVSLPPALSGVKISAIAGAPYLRPRATFDRYPGATFYQLIAAASTPTGDRQWLFIFSAGWLGGNAGYDVPDLAAARGFQTTWAFQAADQPQLELDAAVSSRDFARTINSDHASSAGSTLSYAKAVVALQP